MKKINICKFNRINISKVWFLDIKNEKIEDSSDVVQLYAIKDDNYKKCDKAVQLSWILNLKDDEDNIFNNMKKTTKYDINRAAKDDIEFEIIDSKKLKNNKELIDNFEYVYNKMFKEKGIKEQLSRDTFEKYIINDMVILSRIIKDGIDIVYHVYLYDETTTRFLYSCSNFRSGDNELKKIIGRANKYLHWQDIKYFKKNGLTNYDFGGIMSFENPSGIDEFKMSFPGEKIVYYNYEYSNTFKGKMYLLLKKIYSKLH